MRVQDEFQGLLYYVLLIEKKFAVPELAEKIGIAPSTLYDFAEGRRALPASYVRKLYQATGDVRFLDAVLKPCGMTSSPKPVVDAVAASRDSLTGHLARTIVEVGQVSAAVLEAASDGRIDWREAKRIREEIHEAQTMLSTLDSALPGAE